MKRSLALLAAVAVVATPLVSEAAPAPKKTTRTVSFDYQATTGASIAGVSFALNTCDAPGRCFDFDTAKGEKTVAFKATDASGQPVPFQVYVNDDYEGSVQIMCGAGTLKLSPKAANFVSVRMTATESCSGLPTDGTITATITNT